MLSDYLSRDDIFISYSRKDAGYYAAGLADKLTEKKFSCYIDKLGTEPNHNLPESLKKKIRNCTLFVIIGTEQASISTFVEKEISEFLKTKRTIVPVDFGGTVGRARWYSLVPGLAVEPERSENLKTSDPSPNVISRIEKSFNYTRRNARMRRTFWFALTLFLILVTASAAAAYVAQRNIREAQRQGVIADQKTKEAGEATKVARDKTKEAETATQRASAQERIAQEAEGKATEATRRQAAAEDIARKQEAIARLREKEIRYANINSDLRADTLSPRAPTDLFRLNTLEKLLQIARANHYARAGDIESRIKCIPKTSEQRQILGPDPSRNMTVFDPSGARLFVVYKDRVEVRDGATYELEKTYELGRRTPRAAVWAQVDPGKNALLFEIEYEHFAQPEVEVLRREDGTYYTSEDDVRGREREIFSMTLDANTKPTSLGLSSKLKWEIGKNTVGEENGKSWYELDADIADSSRELVVTKSPDRSQEVKLKKGLGERSRVTKITSRDNKDLYRIEEFVEDIVDVGTTYRIYAVLYSGSGQLLNLNKGVLYNAGAHRYSYQDEQEVEEHLTNVAQLDEPAALNLELNAVLLRNRLIYFPNNTPEPAIEISLDWEKVQRVSLTPNAKGILAYYLDGSIGLFDVEQRVLRNLFLGSNVDGGISVAPDGSAVVLLRKDGSLLWWNLAAFAANGWASANCPYPEQSTAVMPLAGLRSQSPYLKLNAMIHAAPNNFLYPTER